MTDEPDAIERLRDCPLLDVEQSGSWTITTPLLWPGGENVWVAVENRGDDWAICDRTNTWQVANRLHTDAGYDRFKSIAHRRFEGSEL